MFERYFVPRRICCRKGCERVEFCYTVHGWDRFGRGCGRELRGHKPQLRDANAVSNAFIHAVPCLSVESGACFDSVGRKSSQEGETLLFYRKPGFCFGVILALLLIGSATLFAGKFNQVANIGDPLPQFSGLPAADGSTLSSSDLKDDVVVLVFLASHCPWVRGMDGDLIKLVDEFKGQSVRVVGVSVNHREDDRLPAMKVHAARVGYNFTYLYDESQDLGRKLGATHTPEYFVFNKQRKLVYMGAIHNSPAMMRDDGTVSYTKGAPTQNYVKDAIKAALAGTSAPESETRAQGCTVEYGK